MTERILGVDPGASVTGYGIIERSAETGQLGSLVECGVIRTDARQPLWVRLHDLHRGLVTVIETHRPSILAVESVFYRRNVRTTVVLGHARGAVLLAAAQAGLDVVEFAPATVKKTIVGAGGATKSQVGFMVQQMLRLRTPPAPDDAADGVAIALTHLLTSRP